MLAELHVRWEREDEMTRKMKVCTITTDGFIARKTKNFLRMNTN
jgi:hypothetical protein